MDKILINGLRIFAYHGVNPEEKENGQNFVPNGTKIVGRMNQKRPFKGYFIPDYPKNGTSVTFFVWHHIYFATRAILCNFAT